MTMAAGSDARAVVARLQRAQNAHDVAEFVACFDPGYESEQPAHPDRTFRGVEQVRKNWTALFAGIPDFRADLLRSAVDGDVAWCEWHWHGTRSGGEPFEMRGVTIFGVRDGRVAWGRLYMEPVERAGTGIDAAVRSSVAGGTRESGVGNRES